jgi:aminoglycoside phosphotransferase (APT) family kinase protein
VDRGVNPPGRLIGTGRAADVYDIGAGRVLRRYRTAHDSTVEAAGMRVALDAGYPVPEVFDADGRDLVMERLDGPTMLDVIGRRPWTCAAHARQLADLHVRLAAIRPDGATLPVRFEPAECLVHLDLHPGNVVLTERGAVVIDWSNVGVGPHGADVSTTWLLLTVADADDVAVALRPFVAAVRRRLVARFLDGVPRPAAPVLRRVAEQRLCDPNLRAGELANVHVFLDRYAPVRA